MGKPLGKGQTYTVEKNADDLDAHLSEILAAAAALGCIPSTEVERKPGATRDEAANLAASLTLRDIEAHRSITLRRLETFIDETNEFVLVPLQGSLREVERRHVAFGRYGSGRNHGDLVIDRSKLDDRVPSIHDPGGSISWRDWLDQACQDLIRLCPDGEAAFHELLQLRAKLNDLEWAIDQWLANPEMRSSPSTPGLLPAPREPKYDPVNEIWTSAPSSGAGNGKWQRIGPWIMNRVVYHEEAGLTSQKSIAKAIETDLRQIVSNKSASQSGDGVDQSISPMERMVAEIASAGDSISQIQFEYQALYRAKKAHKAGDYPAPLRL